MLTDEGDNFVKDEKIQENDEVDIPDLIKHELAPPTPGATSDEGSSDVVSVFDNTPGKRVFDKHIIDVGVASRIVKGIKDFNAACSEAKKIPNASNIHSFIKDVEEGENDQKASDSENRNKTRTLQEALSLKKFDEEHTNILPPLFTKVHQGLIDLYELIDDGTESVTNVRVAAVRDEIERQKNDQIERFALEGYIAKKEIEALEEYKKIDEKWEHISKLKDPLNIHNETLIQREKCNALLQEKDNVIQYLRDTLKKKDEVFLKEVENQGNDIDILLDRIQNQIYIFKETYTKQLETLEEIIDEEKRIMIESNREKWETLIKDKEEVDKAVLEKLTNIMDTHEVEMRFAEKEQNEHQRKIRSKLHKYINDLTVQVDHLKSICTLNIEKMTYNYHILLKKQQENQVVKQRCKRYAIRMKNNLNALRKEIKKGSQNLANQLVEKANAIDKFHEKINTIDKRCESLICSEAKVYFDLWEFNERKAENLLDQIIAADKILYEKILFMPWSPPAYTRLDKNLIPSYKEAKRLSEYIKKKDKVIPRRLPKVAFEEGQIERLTKVVLDSLRSSCPFFIDEQRKNEISHLPSSDQNLFELENVFEALGLKTKDDVDLMIKYFVPYITCGACLEESFTMKKYKEKESESVIFGMTEVDSTVPQDFTIQKTETTLDLEVPKEDEVAIDTVLYKEQDKEDYLLSDIVKERLQMISDVVVNETLVADTDANKKSFEDGKDDVNKMDSTILKSTVSTGPDIIQEEEVLSVQRFFGIVDHRHSVDWLMTKLNGKPMVLPEEDVPGEAGKEDSIFICSDPCHQPFVNPIDIAKALRDFTTDFYKAKQMKTNLTMEEILSKPKLSPSRVIDPQDVSNYWKAYTEFFTPQKICLWETMIYGLQDYHKALNRRHHLNLELKKLQRSNIELRRLLQRFIQRNPVSKSEMILTGLSNL